MDDRVALVLFAGPEMPCRMIHTFIWALDLAGRGADVKVILEGEAPRWLLALPDPSHGRHGLYRKVKEAGLIDAVCKACAIQAQALEAATEEGLRTAQDASGHVSLAPYIDAGYRIVTL